MKIYLFSAETGLYLGEDFADKRLLGDIVIPADATTIAPPRVEPGQVLLFDTDRQRWEVRSGWKTGRDPEGYPP
jgi:hypothetical protein